MQIQSTNYTIHYGEGTFAALQAYLLENYPSSNIVVLVDDNTFELCLPVLAKEVNAIEHAEDIEIPSGEGNKSLENITHIWETLTGLGADRNTLFVNLGGGMVSDMGGFAAAAYKRGIDYVNVPTTLLAMVDASVGGKTGFDFNSVKNHIGLFSEPKAVFINPLFLDTLPKPDLISGFAEMIKHALIADAGLWQNLKAVDPENAADLTPFIPRCIEIKNTIVQADPYDKNERRKLNFGHTLGHAIEANYIGKEAELLHGEAIAVGMVAEAFIAMEKGMIDHATLKEVEEFIMQYFSVPPIEHGDEENIISLCFEDKKNSNGAINAALLNGIGSCVVDVAISPEEIRKALYYCKALSY